MTNMSLAQSYLAKARARLKILPIFQESGDYSDVVREAQEAVELALKGMLRFVGVEPPKWHDVRPLLMEKGAKFPAVDHKTLQRLSEISASLRKERELAFYGDEEHVPTEEFGLQDGQRALDYAKFVVAVAQGVIV